MSMHTATTSLEMLRTSPLFLLIPQISTRWWEFIKWRPILDAGRPWTRGRQGMVHHRQNQRRGSWIPIPVLDRFLCVRQWSIQSFHGWGTHMDDPDQSAELRPDWST